MSGTVQVKLVVLLDNELRDLAWAYKNLKACTSDMSEDEIHRSVNQVMEVGMQALKHLINDPDAPFIILGSRGKDV